LKNDKQILLELAYALALGLTYFYTYKSFKKIRAATSKEKKSPPAYPQKKRKTRGLIK